MQGVGGLSGGKKPRLNVWKTEPDCLVVVACFFFFSNQLFEALDPMQVTLKQWTLSSLNPFPTSLVSLQQPLPLALWFVCEYI